MRFIVIYNGENLNGNDFSRRITYVLLFYFVYFVTTYLLATSCDSSPCQNGGSCFTSANGGYACQCTAEWTGPRCNTRKYNDKPIIPFMYFVQQQVKYKSYFTVIRHSALKVHISQLILIISPKIIKIGQKQRKTTK